MENKFDIIFIVLTYRNTNDVQKMISSSKKLEKSYKIIIVNSHYDDESTDEFRKIAEENKCDFLDVPNKGYGAGNNKGIEFALNHYSFSFLIVCNPDTETTNIRNIDEYKDGEFIIAPKIIRNDGRNQNPHRAKKIGLSGWLNYYGFKYNFSPLVFVSIALNKIITFSVRNQNKKSVIFSAHGCFVIFTYKTVEKLFPIYDEHMFLFCEEDDLGFRCIQENISVIYDPSIEVIHYEDGSMNMSTIDLKLPMKESYMWMWEKWNKKRSE